MTPSLQPPPAAAEAAASRLPGWRPLGAGAVALASAALAWQGGALALGGLAAAGLALPWLLRGAAARKAAAAVAADEPRVSGGRVGAEVMVSQVVPVWGRQLEVTRAAAADSVGLLLENFAGMSATLDQMVQRTAGFGPGLDADPLHDALERSDGPLAVLLAPSERAFAQRDAAVAELAACAAATAELRQLGAQAREIGKHTRLVAFNAAIEANREGQGADGGALAVAQEMRMLAERIAQVGQRIEAGVGQLEQRVNAQRTRAELQDTTPEELRQELALAARQALSALLGGAGGLAGAMQAMGELQRTGQQLRDQVDAQFIHFQFGDRLSQMLSIVASDMQNFARWVAMNPYATQSDAVEWLGNLEASYTMEEQRAQHHGNVHVDRGSEVEFF